MQQIVRQPINECVKDFDMYPAFDNLSLFNLFFETLHTIYLVTNLREKSQFLKLRRNFFV